MAWLGSYPGNWPRAPIGWRPNIEWEVATKVVRRVQLVYANAKQFTIELPRALSESCASGEDEIEAESVTESKPSGLGRSDGAALCEMGGTVVDEPISVRLGHVLGPDCGPKRGETTSPKLITHHLVSLTIDSQTTHTLFINTRIAFDSSHLTASTSSPQTDGFAQLGHDGALGCATGAPSRKVPDGRHFSHHLALSFTAWCAPHSSSRGWDRVRRGGRDRLSEQQAHRVRRPTRRRQGDKARIQGPAYQDFLGSVGACVGRAAAPALVRGALLRGAGDERTRGRTSGKQPARPVRIKQGT